MLETDDTRRENDPSGDNSIESSPLSFSRIVEGVANYMPAAVNQASQADSQLFAPGAFPLVELEDNRGGDSSHASSNTSSQGTGSERVSHTDSISHTMQAEQVSTTDLQSNQRSSRTQIENQVAKDINDLSADNQATRRTAYSNLEQAMDTHPEVATPIVARALLAPKDVHSRRELERLTRPIDVLLNRIDLLYHNSNQWRNPEQMRELANKPSRALTPDEERRLSLWERSMALAVRELQRPSEGRPQQSQDGGSGITNRRPWQRLSEARTQQQHLPGRLADVRVQYAEFLLNKDLNTSVKGLPPTDPARRVEAANQLRTALRDKPELAREIPNKKDHNLLRDAFLSSAAECGLNYDRQFVRDLTNAGGLQVLGRLWLSIDTKKQLK
jgi:hypothetical protein